MTSIARYLGIDYSGAETPTSRLKGLQVYSAAPGTEPVKVGTPAGEGWNWTRKELAQWLLDQLLSGPPIIAGIDHGFSFPMAYFERHGLPADWPAFLDDFQKHWPTDGDHTYVDFLRDGTRGNAAARSGDSRWRRLTELRALGAKSVFHFDVPGSVAKSTHAGLPWLRYLRREAGERVHFWPFDGFEVPAGSSVVAEVYPRLMRRGPHPSGLTPHEYDAWAVARWLKHADESGSLVHHFAPELAEEEKRIARMEGWILGVA